MTKRKLLAVLCEEVDERSRELLVQKSSELVIGEFNRQTVLRMLQENESGETDSEVLIAPDVLEKVNAEDALKKVDAEDVIEKVNARDVIEMVDALNVFLEKYMADQPQGHKWIILSCVFLSFIAKEPMHPQSVVQWERDDKGRYHCPSATFEEGSLCKWCACGAER